MKKPYIPPVLTVVEFHVEQGFTGSGGGPDLVFWMCIFNDTKESNNQATSYSTEDWNWGS